MVRYTCTHRLDLVPRYAHVATYIPICGKLRETTYIAVHNLVSVQVGYSLKDLAGITLHHRRVQFTKLFHQVPERTPRDPFSENLKNTAAIAASFATAYVLRRSGVVVVVIWGREF